MKNFTVLKLGGSILTHKKAGRPALKTRHIQEIADEIAQARRISSTPLVLLYGAGSFGHPLAYRYALANAPISQKTLIGMGHTVSAIRDLGTRLANVFLAADLPVVPLQTSSCVRMQHGTIRLDASIIRTILESGGIPLMGGDVVFTNTKTTAIASADALAVALALTFGKTRLLFASDTSVYASYPPKRGEQSISVLARQDVQKMIKNISIKQKTTDVTGEMIGKLGSLLKVRGATAVIFNGNTPDAITRALLGKQIGTHIYL